MSSHHIVKEKQEPALLIANGFPCSSALLEGLLEWSPYVLVLDGALEKVLLRQIKIDAVLGDFDSTKVNLNLLKEEQFPLEIFRRPDQEKTDLEKGIELLIEKGFPAVNIIWATGKRMDHTFANITNMIKYRSQIKMVMLDDHSTIYPLSPSQVFTKWYVKGEIVSLIPVGTAKGISTQNLKYPLKNEALELGGRMGNSNEVLQDGEVSISYKTGELLLIESKD